MFRAWMPVVIMAAGWVVYARELRSEASPSRDTIARFQAQRAAVCGMLLTVLLFPWLLVTSIMLLGYRRILGMFSRHASWFPWGVLC
jgi:hypothetical protein